MTKNTIKTLLFLLVYSSHSYADDLCQKLLSLQIRNTSLFTTQDSEMDSVSSKVSSKKNSNFSIYDVLSIDIGDSLKRANLDAHPGVYGLLPDRDLKIFSAKDMKILDGFPVADLAETDYIIETDFGYAVMSEEDFKHWYDLAETISTPKSAKDYLEQAANTKNLYLPGLVRSSFDWLRWSVDAKFLAREKAKKFIEGKSKHYALSSKTNVLELQNKFYKEMVREKEFFIFPFGIEKNEALNFISAAAAVKVLRLLARHFLLSKLYVKRDSDGLTYVKLSDVLDRDSLMLMSRFPELLPVAPIFESGHFEVAYDKTKITYNDSYRLSAVSFSNKTFKGTDFKSDFRSVVHESQREVQVSGYLTMSLGVSDVPSNMLSITLIEKLYEIETEKMNIWLTRKINAFNTEMGYDLPQAHFKFLLKSSDTFKRNYKVEFALDLFEGALRKTPPHVLAAFYVFIGMNTDL